MSKTSEDFGNSDMDFTNGFRTEFSLFGNNLTQSNY